MMAEGEQEEKECDESQVIVMKRTLDIHVRLINL